LAAVVHGSIAPRIAAIRIAAISIAAISIAAISIAATSHICFGSGLNIPRPLVAISSEAGLVVLIGSLVGMIHT